MSYVVLVAFEVPEWGVSTFLQAAQADVVASLQEPGTVAFEIIKDAECATRFYLHEVYNSEHDFATHCQGSAFKTFFSAIESLGCTPQFLVKGLKQ